MLLTTLLAVLGTPPAQAADPLEPTSEQIQAAVTKSLPLLQKGSAETSRQRTCFTCHNHALPMLAVSLARQRGFAVDEEGFRKQAAFVHNVYATWAKKSPDHKNIGGGGSMTAGYALLALAAADWKPDEATAAVVDYLLHAQTPQGHWRSPSNRPPSEVSHFTATALALRGLETFGTQQHKERLAEQINQTRQWLLQTPAQDTEDHVFRLWALRHGGFGAKEIEALLQELTQSQREDGGWAQTAERESDAYATGSVLVALHQAGGMRTNDSAYHRGLKFLLQTQQPDGSWLVKSRSKPFQTYFESGFPHGKDQFISITASGWATAALALACPMPAK